MIESLFTVMLRDDHVVRDGGLRLCGLRIQITKQVHRPEILRVVLYHLFVFTYSGTDLPLCEVPLGIAHCLCFIETHCDSGSCQAGSGVILYVREERTSR